MHRSHLAAVILAGLLSSLAGWPLVVTAHQGNPMPPDREPDSYASRSIVTEIYDRTVRRVLPIHTHRGRLYVAGEPGHEYELRLRNHSDRRVLIVTSVDGVNVITGETAGVQQSGYVLEPRDELEIEGWRKSMDAVATFYFTRLSNSYAARTGRPQNVGVIGFAIFRERPPLMRDEISKAPVHVPGTPAESRADAAADGAITQRPKDQLGTGHGRRETSPAEYVNFERASATPEETIAIHYDSRENLIARGIIREPRRQPNDGRPNPFPNEFVPDP